MYANMSRPRMQPQQQQQQQPPLQMQPSSSPQPLMPSSSSSSSTMMMMMQQQQQQQTMLAMRHASSQQPSQQPQSQQQQTMTPAQLPLPNASSTDESLHNFVAVHHLEECGLPLQQLSRLPGTSTVALGFDGNKVLDVITARVRAEDPMAVFTISTPFTLYNQVNDYSELVTSTLPRYFAATATTFKPVFVFNGCGFMPTADIDPVAPRQPTELAMNRAYLTTNSVSAVPPETAANNASRFVIEDDVEALVVRLLHAKCRDTFRAPYLAWSQLSAFLSPRNRYVSEVYGSLELLAFPGVERVVTRIDDERGTFDCVSKASVLRALQAKYGAISDDDFAALVLFDSRHALFHVKNRDVGFEGMCRVPVTLASPSPPSTTATTAAAGTTQSPRSRVEAVLMSCGLSAVQRRLLCRNAAALDAPVLTCEGQCTLLSTLYGKMKRTDVGDFFGRPLPVHLFYCMTAGPALTEPFAMLSQSALADDWPLIDTPLLRDVAQSILPLRVQIALQLYQQLRIVPSLSWLRQYIVFRTGEMDDMRWSPIKMPPMIVLVHWDFDLAELPEYDDDAVYYCDITRFASLSVTSDKVVYQGVRATVAATLLRSLDLLGYLSHNTLVGGVVVSGPSVYSQAVDKFVCPTLCEYGVLIIELVRTRALHDNPITLTLNDKDVLYLPGVRFAARLLSVIPLNMDGPWSGPFDPEMAAFGVVTRLVARTCRSLTEVLAAIIFHTRSTSVPLHQFDEVLHRLPFALPTEFNAGFLMTYIFLNPTCTLANLQRDFAELYCLEADLQTLFWFWVMAYDALRHLKRTERLSVSDEVLHSACLHVSEACRRLMPQLWEQLYVPLYETYPELLMPRWPYTKTEPKQQTLPHTQLPTPPTPGLPPQQQQQQQPPQQHMSMQQQQQAQQQQLAPPHHHHQHLSAQQQQQQQQQPQQLPQQMMSHATIAVGAASAGMTRASGNNGAAAGGGTGGGNSMPPGMMHGAMPHAHFATSSPPLPASMGAQMRY